MVKKSLNTLSHINYVPKYILKNTSYILGVDTFDINYEESFDINKLLSQKYFFIKNNSHNVRQMPPE